MRYFLLAFLLGVYLLFVYGYIRKKVSEKSVVKLSSLTLPIPAVCFGLALILQTDYSKLLLKTGQTTLSPEKVSFLSYIVFVGTLIVLVSKSIEWLYEAKNALRILFKACTP